MNARDKRRRDDEENVAAIARLFAAVDAIDEDVAAKQKPYPNRGAVPCPTCGGRIAYVNLTEIKGAGRCSTPDCVDFAPLF
jgi:hypothetical protein